MKESFIKFQYKKSFFKFFLNKIFKFWKFQCDLFWEFNRHNFNFKINLTR